MVDLWWPLETFINIFKMIVAQKKIFAAQTFDTILVAFEEGGMGVFEQGAPQSKTFRRQQQD